MEPAIDSVSGEVIFQGEYAAIPPRMQAAIMRYVLNRVKPGDFLTAVICNDLRQAVGLADAENSPLIPLYVRWLTNNAPSVCWGDAAAMRVWLQPSPVLGRRAGSVGQG